MTKKTKQNRSFSIYRIEIITFMIIFKLVYVYLNIDHPDKCKTDIVGHIAQKINKTAAFRVLSRDASRSNQDYFPS